MTLRRRGTSAFRFASLASIFFFAVFIHANALSALAEDALPPPDAVIEETVQDTNPQPGVEPTPLPWENGGNQKTLADQEAAKKEEERKRRAAGWIDPASKAGAVAGAKAATGVTMGTVGKWAAIGGGIILIIALVAGGGGGGSSTPPAHQP